MKKSVLFCALIIFLIQLVSSLELGLSPPHSDLNGNSYEKLCQNFSLYSSQKINVSVIDKWTEINRSRDLRDYNLDSDKFKIKVTYPKKIFIIPNKKEIIEVCFLGENTGNFYGAVLFESEKGYASIGSWINLKIEGAKKEKLILTGSVIGEGNINHVMIGICFILIIILLFLLIKLNKKSRGFV